MIINYFVLIGLIVGSFTDIKTREVPDWVNFSLIGIGFGISALSSLIFNTYSYIINSIAGFLLCLIIALIMFYSGQWGGGDSKMIMALGALIGLDIFNINFRNFSLISFLINILIIGAFYGLIWGLILSVKNRKKFIKEAKKIFSKKINKFLLLLALTTILLIVSIKNLLIKINLFLILVLLLLYYLWYLTKIIENACMFNYVKPQELTEGDWIAKDIKINNKYICGPKDLGISKKQINKLLKYYKIGKIKKVLIKQGIPFVPSFLVAFIITLIYGNLLFLLI